MVCIHKKTSNLRIHTFLKCVEALLTDAGLHTKDNFNFVVAAAQHSRCFVTTLRELNEGKLLTKENFKKVAENPALTDTLPTILSALRQTKLLTQDVFTKLLEPQHAFLCSQEADTSVWSKISHALLTETVLNGIFTCAAQENPQDQLNKYVSFLKNGLHSGNTSVPFRIAHQTPAHGAENTTSSQWHP